VRGAEEEEHDHDRGQKYINQPLLSVLGKDVEREIENDKMTSY
jgi:hypothetical protein